MFRRLLATTDECHLTILRLTAGIIIFRHGLQQTFGLFGGRGFTAQMAIFSGEQHIPVVFAFLAIMAEFLGGIGLITGFLARIAAFGVCCNMLISTYLVNLPNGYFMNGTGRQRGEGIEFQLLAAAIAIAIMMKGAGPLSIDRAITKIRT